MAKAAEDIYRTLRRDGTQQAVVDRMQTRMELYDVLGYQAYEDKLDRLFEKQGLTNKKD
jgi:methylisocitrate lyase